MRRGEGGRRKSCFPSFFEGVAFDALEPSLWRKHRRISRATPGPLAFCCSQRTTRVWTSGHCGPEAGASGLCPTAVFGDKLGAVTPAHAANRYRLVTSLGPS